MDSKKVNYKSRFKTILLLSCCCGLISCVSNKKIQQSILADKSYCNKQQIELYTDEKVPKPIHTIDLDAVLKHKFSKQALNIAHAIGVLELLEQYVKLSNENQTTVEKRLQLLEIAQQINQKINLASLEVSAVASELDCEEERANQFASYLKETEGKTENKLVVSSIILGAAGAVSSEIIANNSSNTNFSSGFTIGVSLVEASLGVLMLVNKKKINFYHPDNPLTDIWSHSKVSTYFPASIWYYLTYENTIEAKKSLAQLLVEKWQLFGQISNVKSNENTKSNQLFFGNGGKYEADQLLNRADMLDQTESYVTLMKQDLKMLTFEVNQLTK